jgi:hypothetical protein
MKNKILLLTAIALALTAFSMRAAPVIFFGSSITVSNALYTNSPISLPAYPLVLPTINITVTGNNTTNGALLNTNSMVVPIRVALGNPTNWVGMATLYMPSTNAGTYPFTIAFTNIPIYIDGIADASQSGVSTNSVNISASYGN